MAKVVVTEDDKLRLEDTKQLLIDTFTLFRRRAGQPNYKVGDKWLNLCYKAAKVVEALGVTPEDYVRMLFEQHKPYPHITQIASPPNIVTAKKATGEKLETLKMEVRSFSELLRHSLAADNTLAETLENPVFSFSIIFKYLMYKAYNDPTCTFYENKAQNYLQNPVYQEAYAELMRLADTMSKEIIK